MRTSINTIRNTLIIIFLIISIGLIVFLVNQIYLTAFAIGWGGGNATIIEVLWIWNWILLLTLYSILSTIGQILRRKLGVLLGYVVVVSMLLYMVIGISYDISLGRVLGIIDFSLMTFILIISTLLILALTKMKKRFHKFNKLDYTAGIILIQLLIYTIIEKKML